MTDKQEEKKPFVIVPQTRVLFIAYVLLGVAMLMLSIASPVALGWQWFLIVYYAAAALLSLYVINCTVVGNCKTFAWIMAYVYLVIAFSMGLLAIIALYKKK